MGASKIIIIILSLLLIVSFIALVWLLVSGILSSTTAHIKVQKMKIAAVETCMRGGDNEAIIKLKNTGIEKIVLTPLSDAPFSFIKNLPLNPNFEIDANNDGVPDGWEVSNITADVVLITDLSNSMQRCMDDGSTILDCPTDANGKPSNCRHESPCSFDCSVWAGEERYCSNSTKYFKTTYAKKTDLAGNWHLDEGSGNKAYDSSGNGNNGTLLPVGSGPQWVEGKFGSALNFSSAGEYVAAPANGFDMAKGSILFWYKPDYNHNDGVLHGIFALTGLAGEGFDIFKYSSNTLELDVERTGSDSSHKISPSSYSWTAGGWIHLAFLWDDSKAVSEQMAIYLNGVKLNPYSTGVDYNASTYSTPTGMRIGATGSNTKGVIDEVKIYSRALTQSEIQEGIGDCIYLDNEISCTDSDYPNPVKAIPDYAGGEALLSSCNATYPYPNGTILTNCNYESGCAKTVCGGLGKIYSGNASFGAITEKASCGIGECDVGDTYKDCQYINRSSCFSTACPSGWYDRGDRIEYTIFKPSCDVSECDVGDNYKNCSYFNQSACNLNACPSGWYNLWTSTQYIINKPSCIGGECDIGDSYQDCQYINRTSWSVSACSAGWYDIGDRLESSIWRTSCLASERIENTRNVAECVETTTCESVSGYFTCSEAQNLSCESYEKGCCKAGSSEYLCTQYSDNCCKTKMDTCRLNKNYCCQIKEEQCRLYSDNCCKTKLEQCQNRTYECCDQLTKCYKQRIKCCNDNPLCQESMVKEVAFCEAGYTNGPPSLANNCDTEKCEVKQDCFYCENVAVRLAKKLDKGFINDMISSGNKVGLVSYGTTVQNWLDLTGDETMLPNQINSYQANANQTCISCAIDKSIDILKNSPNARFMVLMSDGEANVMLNGTYGEAGAKSEAINLGCKAYQDYKISIYTIGFGGSAGTETLQKISNCTGGKFYYGRESQELSEIYKNVAVDIAGRIDNLNKVYGNNSMKIIGGQNKKAESAFIKINATHQYMLANYLRLNITEGDFLIEVSLFDISYMNIANLTIKTYPSTWEGFRKETYLMNFSNYTEARYGRLVYKWWNPVNEPQGTAWIDDVFLGPVISCSGSGNFYKCGDITITKIKGYGDLYPYIDMVEASPQDNFNIKDSNCISKTCNYLVCSPGFCSEVSCR